MSKRIFRKGNVEVTQAPNGMYWVKTLPYHKDLKRFRLRKNAMKYARKLLRKYEGRK